jgi:GTP cyclohydrolase I
MNISSESAPSTRRANINETSERVVRLLAAIPKLEGDNKDMKEDNMHVDIEEDNIDILHTNMVFFCMYEYCLLPFLHCFPPNLYYHHLIWE